MYSGSLLVARFPHKMPANLSRLVPSKFFNSVAQSCYRLTSMYLPILAVAALYALSPWRPTQPPFKQLLFLAFGAGC